ncbi:hypothetical protein [Manganibacter manganicus]|uniref:DUF945 domain-containing protein n=1 Tax=Manganibacter manganicus TaxID=1873176 RepID=A0A1V8RWG3_9HYPH|nr:hypothetical protein [Pseudaminobacter manganicus]OQM77530.1 hypothetical protein BFN67_01450 [Pseudaminobacter manganicus]
MRTIPATVSKLAFAGLLAVLPLHSAFAQDATAVAERLKTLLAGQGLELTWSGVDGDASKMTLESVMVKAAGEKDGLPIGDIVLEGVSEDNGGYTIDTASTGNFTRTKDGTTIELSPFVMHGVSLPAEGSTDPLASIMMYKSANLDHLTVKKGDKTAFSLENFTVDVTLPADGNPLEFKGSVEEFTGDLSLVKDPKSKQAIDALGYQTISGNMKMAGSWQPSDGQMVLSQYDIAVDNAGTFGLTFSIGGYTLDFIKSLQDLQKKMAAQPEGADSSAQSMAMLGLMQQLTFTSASIRFDDDSLTNKILDYVGKQQGMSGKDIANQAKAIVPFGLAQLNNPELTAQASKAVNAYLDDPRSIEITAKPATPVPFAMIAAGAMSDPKTLTKTLGVSVTANQD